MKKIAKIVLIIVIVILLILATVFVFREKIFVFFLSVTETSLETGVQLHTHGNGEYEAPHEVSSTTLEEGVAAESSTSEEKNIEVVAKNLQIPWEIAFLPNGDILVTERPGTLKRIGGGGNVYPITGVKHVGEGGLLGVALHPQFSENQLLYVYLTTKTKDGLINKVERYRFNGDVLSEKTVIIDNIPGARYHDGGRIAFGPDGYLYITVGDAGKPDNAQDTSSLSGKILRLLDDGSIPPDNPFGNAVYSYGHRNPQGLVWDDKDQLWSTEHGPFGFDELNLIKKGKNYGWPIIKGDEIQVGMEPPIVHSGPDETWAPSGMAFYENSLFFSGLRGETLYEAQIENGNVIKLKAHFRKEFGRLRAVVIGPDNSLYISTSNTDNRGKERNGDDKIIKIPLEIFKEN